MFSEKELNLEEHEIREVVRALPTTQQFRYHQLEVRLLKRPSTYKALNWLFPLGVHHFYLGRWARGLITLSLTLGGILMIVVVHMTAYGIMLLLATVLIEIPQLLNARLLVHSRNNRIMAACLKQAQSE
jgi:TM2 domain-containing membrane protein YozV